MDWVDTGASETLDCAGVTVDICVGASVDVVDGADVAERSGACCVLGVNRMFVGVAVGNALKSPSSSVTLVDIIPSASSSRAASFSSMSYNETCK